MSRFDSPISGRGFSLIEVLVTVIILAIGLLGLAGLQMTSLQQNTTAYERSIASMLAYEIIDRMHANVGSSAAYVTALDAPPPGDSVGCDLALGECTAAEMAQYDLTEWKCALGTWSDEAECNGIAGLLPMGDGSIVIETAGQRRAIVTIRWLENRDQEAAVDMADDMRWTSLIVEAAVRN